MREKEYEEGSMSISSADFEEAEGSTTSVRPAQAAVCFMFALTFDARRESRRHLRLLTTYATKVMLSPSSTCPRLYYSRRRR